MEIEKINTELGYLNNRDTIHLDKVIHDSKSSILVFSGQINGKLTSISQENNWINYKLEFRNIHSYKCILLDDFNENLIKSSFDKLLKQDESKFTDYIFSTYDHVFEIKAENHKFIFDGITPDGASLSK